MERLAAAENRGKGLDRHADDVVFRLLRGQRLAPVCAWKRNISELGRARRSDRASLRAHKRRAARYLAICSRIDCAR